MSSRSFNLSSFFLTLCAQGFLLKQANVALLSPLISPLKPLKLLSLHLADGSLILRG
jgi:hypothetical protein